VIRAVLKFDVLQKTVKNALMMAQTTPKRVGIKKRIAYKKCALIAG